MKVRISLEIGVETEDCDESTAREVELHLAQFREQLEAAISNFLEARAPDVKFSFSDDEGEEWK